MKNWSRLKFDRGETMDKNEFMEYINEEFDISGEAERLIYNILSFIERNYDDEGSKHMALHELLDGTIGLDDDEIEKICL